MARKQSKNASTGRAESAGASEVEASSQGEGGRVNKAEAVRAAIDAGYDDLDAGLDYVRDHFGIDMSKQHFSTIKSQYRKKAGAAPRGKPGPRPRGAGGTESVGDAGLIESLETLKPLIDQYGSERVKRLVDLLG